MSESRAGRRGSNQRTQFDDSNRRTLLYGVIAVVVVAILVGVLVALSIQNPDLGLSLQLGGLPKAANVEPRNFRLWAIQPDGRLRFATAFYPPRTNAPASEVFTVAGPLIDNEDDILQTNYFGALNINSKTQAGTGGDSSRYYKLFWVEHDPSVAAYGVDMITQKPPYIVRDPADKTNKMSYIAMGAPQQAYYSQVTVAVALPPGTKIDHVAYPLPVTGDIPSTESMLRPYRRVMINGWTVYYFDQSSLELTQVVRIRYTPPADPTKEAPELNLWEVDRQR